MMGGFNFISFSEILLIGVTMQAVKQVRLEH